MLGLNSYASSDEESEQEAPANAEDAKPHPQITTTATASQKRKHDPSPPQARQDLEELPSRHKTTPAREIGPAPGPSAPPPPIDEADMDVLGEDSGARSPRTRARKLMQDLTMPPVPNFDIPASPPGSPPPQSTAKFTKFLELREKGVRFNEKLESSSALRNPALLDKLRAFAGIDDEMQYASALPPDLALPTKFPAEAYADELNKAQQRIAKAREEEQAKQRREAIDFVPASTASGSSSRAATPGGARNVGRSAAERVMAGLQRDEKKPAQRHDGAGKRDLEHRGGQREDGRWKRRRSRSR